MCSLYHGVIHKVLVQHNLDQTQYAFKSFLLIYDCMKVMCETDSLGSKIVVVFLWLLPSSVSVQHDDTYRLKWYR